MSFPARIVGGGGASGLEHWTKEVELTLVTQWAMCPTARSTKGVSQVILHMLLSGFFNTCSFCFCHPALHGDINLWLADSQAQVSAYSCKHIRTLDFPERICLFFSSFKTNVCHGRWSRARHTMVFFPSLNIVLIVWMNKTVASADVLIRGQDLKVNLCSESHRSPFPPLHPNQSLTSALLTKLYQKTVCGTYRPVDVIKIRADFTETSDSRIEKWHTLCVSWPACLPFNPRGLFLVNLHNSRTWASMGPPFHPEPKVQCYSWTLKGKVKPRKRGLRSRVQGRKSIWSQRVVKSHRLLAGSHRGAKSEYCACDALGSSSSIYYRQNIIIPITSCLMYNSISSLFKV